MATENLLVNIEVDTKPAKRGVEDLNKALSENAKQTKSIQKELHRLEKEYKSIATAVNKLPSDQVGKLAKEVKKVDKATSKLHGQFDRTTRKLERVQDRVLTTSETFGVLAASMLSLARLDPLIRFSNQIVKASQAVLVFNRTLVPVIENTQRLLNMGLKKFPAALNNFRNSIGLVLPMIREQTALFKGHQVVVVQTMRFMEEFNRTFSLLSRGASQVNRALTGVKMFVEVTGEGVTRVTRIFRTFGDMLGTTGKILGEFRSAWFGTFGPSSGGAAQVNNFQQALLNLQYYAEITGKKITSTFGKLGAVGASAARSFTPLLSTIKQIAPAFVGATAGVVAFVAGLARIPAVAFAASAAVSTFTTLTKAVESFFDVFGPRSAGAGHINFFQQQLLNLKYFAETAGKRFKDAFYALPGIFKQGGDALKSFASQAMQVGSVFRNDIAKAFSGKTFSDLAGSVKAISLTSFSGMFSRLSVVMAETVTVARGFSVIMKDSFQLALKTMLTTAIQASSGMITLGQSVGLLSKGLVGTIETSNLAGIGLIGLGFALKQTDIAFLDFIGTAVQFAGVFSLTIAGALTFAVGAIGRFSIAVGDTLINAMNQWELKFEKVQAVTQAFQFTIQGFGKTIGEVATGSIGFWNSQVEEMVATTNFGAAEVQKSIKILIAEGAQLGITASQNAQILKRAGDIAAVTGNDLSHVALAIARGLAGNAASLQDMGIFVNQASLEHSKYAQSSNLVVSALSKEEKAQLALNVIFEQTIPLIGGAADQLNTITGANKQYTQTVDTLLARLGSQSSLFVKLTQVQTEFFMILNKLPTGLIDFISVSVDVAGVGLKLTGVFLTLIVTFASLKSAYEILNFTMRESTALQTGLNFVIGLAAERVGVQAIAVTSLSTLMKAVSGVVIPGLVIAIRSFQAALISSSKTIVLYTGHLLFTAAGWKVIMLGAAGATAAVLRFTAALLASPWTWILGSIAATMVAYNQLTEKLSVFKKAVEDVNGVVSKTPGLLEQLGTATKNILQLFVNLATAVVIGWMEIYTAIQLAASGYQGMWAKITGNTKAFDEQKKETKDLVEKMRMLDMAFSDLLPKWAGGTAHAQTMTTQMGQLAGAYAGAADTVKGFSTALKLSEDVAENVRIDVLGDEFDKANKKLAEANSLLGNLRKQGVIKIGTEILLPTSENLAKFVEGTLDKDGKKAQFSPAAGTDELSKAAIEAEKARLELVKLRRDGIKELQRTLMTQEALALEANNQAIEAIKLRGAEELRLITEKILGQQKIAPLKEKELELVNKLKAAIQASTAAEVAKKQVELDAERNKQLEDQARKLANIRNQFQALNREGLEGANDLAAIAKLDYDLQSSKLQRLGEQAALQAEMTDGAGKLKGEYQAALDRAQELAKEKFENVIDQQRFSSQFAKAIEAVDPRNFAGKMAQEFLLGLNKIGRFGADMVNGFITAFKGVNLSEGFGASLNKIIGNLNLTGVANALKGMDFSSLANIGSSLKNVGSELFKDVDWGQIGANVGIWAGEKFIQGAALIGDLFDPEQIGKIADFFGEFLQKLPNELGKAFQKLDSVLVKFIDAFPKLLTTILEALPGLVKSIMDKIPMIIDALVNGIVQLLDALPGIIQVILNALPGIFKKIMEALPTIITSIFKALGEIIPQLIAAIPELIKIIIDGIPDIVLAFVEGFIAALGQIVVALVDFFIGGGLEKIIGAILRAIPKIVVALVKGIVNGLKRALGSIFGGIKAPESLTSLPKKFTDGLNNLGKKATEESSKLFKVLDLGGPAAGIAGKGPGEALESATRFLGQTVNGLIAAWRKLWGWIVDRLTALWNFLKSIWDFVISMLQSLWELLKAVWDTVITALTTIMDGIKAAFQWVFDNILKPFMEGLTTAFTWIYENILKPFTDAITVVFTWVNENIIQPIASIFSTAFDGIKDFFSNIFSGKISEAFKGIFENFGEVGGKIWEAFKKPFQNAGDLFSGLGDSIWGGLKKGLDGLGDFFKKMFDKLNPGNLFEKIFKVDYKGKGTVEDFLKIDLPFLKFAEGGMVPGKPVVSGDSEMNDRILALLSPGEAVVPRSVMDKPALASIIKAVMSGDINPQKHAGGVFGALAKGDVSSALSQVANAAESMDPRKLWEDVKNFVFDEMLVKMFEANSFHAGGMVPAMAGGGDVPAMLQSGEFVINRQAVQSLGLGTLNQMNQGNAPANQEFNFEIKMDVKADNLPDESFIRQRLIPAMKKELKDASLRGEFLMSNKGLRTT